jgi:hypothetical protein
MIRLGSLKLRLRAGAGLALGIAAIYAASSAFVCGADTKAGDSASTNTNSAPAKAAEVKPAKQVKKQLTGAELYSINCNRCHPERYPTEFNSTHWKTLMVHMRVRANLPAAQAKQILKYFQEESGN